MGWGSVIDAIDHTFKASGLPEVVPLDFPAAPPPPVVTVPPALTKQQVAILQYMGIDPVTAPRDQIDRALGLPSTPPPAAPPPAGTPPPPPGAPTPDSAGQAATASEADAAKVKAALDDLAELDKQAAAALDEIHTAGVEGRQQLDNIQKDVEAKIQELGPRLNTPQGQQELREFLKDKLSTAKNIIDKHISDAEAAARKSHETAQKYGDVGGDTTSASSPDTGDDPPPPDTPPPPATEPVAAATAPAATAPTAPMSGMPMGGGMPGMGGMPSMGGFPMPSFGGGGMPGMGGGSDPFSDAGSAPHGGDPIGFHDQAPDSHGDGTDTTKFQADDTNSPEPHHDSSGTQPAASDQPSGDGHPDAHTVVVADADTGPDTKSTDVKLPDGTVVQARNPQEAIAARAHLGGATVTDAYKSAGVDLPPPGTPVTDPLPPTQLQAGDVGVWKDHMVMALGNGKVLVNGQVQPQDSLGSGPDFLGWINPTSHTAPPAPAVPPPPPAQPPLPS